MIGGSLLNKVLANKSGGINSAQTGYAQNQRTISQLMGGV